MSLHRLLALTALSLLVTTACGDSAPTVRPGDKPPDAGPIDAGTDSGVPDTAPGAPSSVTATAGNAQATVSWQAPANNGGRPLTHYTLVPSPSGAPITVSPGSLSAVVPGLSNGTTYTFQVFASNTVGQGPGSTPSNPVTPQAFPSAPTQVSATAGNEQAVVSWQAPLDPGSSPVTSYAVIVSPGGAQLTVGAGSLSATVTGLSNGTAYTFRIFAVTAVGRSPDSAPSNPVIPATVPSAPSQVSATAGNAQATVSWLAPATTGGLPVTGYIVTTLPGGAQLTVSAGTLSTVVTGLSNGGTYSFRVSAANAMGRGPDSPASNAVTPATVPTAPTQVAATGGNAQATVSWQLPAANGGSPLTGYTVVASPGGARVSVGAATFSTVVPGLSNGTAYTFQVFASNAVGQGPGSAPSNAVTPATVPTAPTQVAATAGNAMVTVTWQAPASNGGSALTGYTVIVSPDGSQIPVDASTPSLTLTGLTNGTTYSFQVFATNAVGRSPNSAPSNSVTPATVPSAPSQVSATAGNAQATVSWQVPISDGGSPITGYTVTASPGGAQVSVGAAARSATVTGLTNGTAYTFRVFATNALGRGPDSAASNAVTPNALPSAPTQAVATGGNAQATVSWQAPADTGGTSLTGYTVSASPGPASVSVAGNLTSATVTGLANGTSYTFTVVARNALGPGPASAPSNPVTPATVPAAPTQVAATAGENGAIVTWAAPVDNGGSALTGYRISSSPASPPSTVSAGATGVEVIGLSAGTAYTFTVQALNAVGASVPSSPSNAVTPLQRVQVFIGFDNLPSATAVTNQYPQLTLSSAPGQSNSTLGSASTFNTSVPNILCTPGCDDPTYIDFTRPARDVKLKAVGVNGTGKAFAVLVHRSGQPVTRLEYTGLGQTYVPLPVDLSALGDITRVELVEITDGYGVGWDDFSFSTLQ